MKVYIRCIDSLDLLRNLTLLKVQNNENSMESMYVRCTDHMNLLKNLNSLNVQNRENSRKNSVH